MKVKVEIKSLGLRLQRVPELAKTPNNGVEWMNKPCNLI